MNQGSDDSSYGQRQQRSNLLQPSYVPHPSTTSSSSSQRNPGEESSSTYQSLQPKQTDSTELTSPSKSIKNFFKNRLSSHSIESISEEPELPRGGRSKKKSAPSSGSNEISPSRGGAGLNQILRPKFTRSRSSGQSTPSAPSYAQNAPPLPREHRPTTLEDFVDSESSDENDRSREDAESIGSVIHEYGRDSNYRPGSNPSNFIFHEEFDEVPSKPAPPPTPQHAIRQDNRKFAKDSPQTESPTTNSSSYKTDSPHSENSANIIPRAPSFNRGSHLNKSRAVDAGFIGALVSHGAPAGSKRTSTSSNDSYDKNASGNSSITSLRFKVHNDKIEPVVRGLSDKRKLGEPNRSSLYNHTTYSDSDNENKYPDPDLSNSTTPMQTPTRGTTLGSVKTHSSLSETIGTDSIEDIGLSQPVQGSSSDRSRALRSVAKAPTDDPNDYGGKSQEDYREGKSSLLSIIPADDETRDTLRDSLSSGELLNKLESYYDKTSVSEGSRGSRGSSHPSRNSKGSSGRSAKSRNSNLLSSARYSDDAKSTFANLTAGLDSNNDLPVMLYKVQDKDFDESAQRWSLYDHDKGEGSPGKHATTVSSNSSDSYNRLYHNASNAYPPINDPKVLLPTAPQQAYLKTASRSGSEHSSFHDSSRSHSETSSLHSGNNKEYIAKMFDDRIGEFTPKTIQGKSAASLGGTKKVTIPIPEPDSSRRPAPRPEENYYFDDIEKEIDNLDMGRKRQRKYTPKFEYQSWFTYGGLMLLGLIIPPIYLLVACGLFDNVGRNSKNYYSGLYYYDEKPKVGTRVTPVKRFSRTQKVLSLLIGLTWFTIVLAMIGVGLGLGLSRGG
ncbi:uncharacterized protein RJT20DRAFT_2208 [Scheffersomyces xylosifermentans]|uniref:uncharacterized protein n=1 Tax=Scheffersomyces xylosifermentans TaxID=1304137 RepID=UPI00315C9F71